MIRDDDVAALLRAAAADIDVAIAPAEELAEAGHPGFAGAVSSRPSQPLQLSRCSPLESPWSSVPRNPLRTRHRTPLQPLSTAVGASAGFPTLYCQHGPEAVSVTRRLELDTYSGAAATSSPSCSLSRLPHHLLRITTIRSCGSRGLRSLSTRHRLRRLSCVSTPASRTVQRPPLAAFLEGQVHRSSTFPNLDAGI